MPAAKPPLLLLDLLSRWAYFLKLTPGRRLQICRSPSKPQAALSFCGNGTIRRTETPPTGVRFTNHPARTCLAQVFLLFLFVCFPNRLAHTLSLAPSRGLTLFEQRPRHTRPPHHAAVRGDRPRRRWWVWRGARLLPTPMLLQPILPQMTAPLMKAAPRCPQTLVPPTADPRRSPKP